MLINLRLNLVLISKGILMSSYELPANTAVIGKIPGYNKNIDPNGMFANELLKGVTFIDLMPMSYKTIMAQMFSGKDENGNAIDELTLKNLEDYLGKSVEILFGSGALFEQDVEPAKKNYKSLLTRLNTMNDEENYFGSKFSDVDMLRIIAANDSTFVENFSNNFDGANVVQNTYNAASQNKYIKLASQFANISKSMNYTQAQNFLMEGMAKGDDKTNAMSAFAQGVIFNANLATPTTWTGSNYSSSLSLFIKLISPVGSPACIRANILTPLMYLLAATAPVTSYGLFYGAPMLWEINAKGVAHFRLGAVASLSVMRGSFETTFTKDLQPTVLDVRITLVSLLNDFAVQSSSMADGKLIKSLYNKDAQKNLSVQNPYDIYAGSMNSSDKNKVVTTTINL